MNLDASKNNLSLSCFIHVLHKEPHQKRVALENKHRGHQQSRPGSTSFGPKLLDLAIDESTKGPGGHDGKVEEEILRAIFLLEVALGMFSSDLLMVFCTSGGLHGLFLYILMTRFSAGFTLVTFLLVNVLV